MIEPVKKDLESVIQAELQRAKDAHGAIYHSPHEAYAVLREEIEEVAEALDMLKDRAEGKYKEGGGDNYLWVITRGYKGHMNFRDGLLNMYKYIMFWAKEIAAEAVQVAGVCQKAIESMDAWKKE